MRLGNARSRRFYIILRFALNHFVIRFGLKQLLLTFDMTILSCAFRWMNFSLQFFLWQLQEAEIGSFKGNNFASLMWNQEENWDKMFSFTLEQFSHLLDLFVSGDTESTLLSQEEGRFDCNWIVLSKLSIFIRTVVGNLFLRKTACSSSYFGKRYIN